MCYGLLLTARSRRGLGLAYGDGLLAVAIEDAACVFRTTNWLPAVAAGTFGCNPWAVFHRFLIRSAT